MLGLKWIQGISGILIAISLLASCVNSGAGNYGASCGIDFSDLHNGKEIDLVGDYVPRQTPKVSLWYYSSLKSVLAISDSGKCVQRINMLSENVSQYPHLIGVVAAIPSDDVARKDFAAFIDLQYTQCERNPENYTSSMSHIMGVAGGASGKLSHMSSSEEASMCGTFIAENSYVANILDGDDMVAVSIFGSKIFVARKKWQ